MIKEIYKVYVKKIILSFINYRYNFRGPNISRLFNNIANSDSDMLLNNNNSHFQPNDLIFSTDTGVYILNNGRVNKILNGKFYGISRFYDYYIVARSNNFSISNKINDKSKRQSDIWAFKINDSQGTDLKLLSFGIPGEIHQIDVIKDKLVFPLTGYNLILSFSLQKLLLKNKNIITTSFYRMKKTTLKLQKPTHLNSIYFSYKLDTTFLIAHNSTAHTERTSDIISINNTNQIEITNTSAHSAHNICHFNDGMMFCDSNNKKLLKGNECLFETNKLLRGLAIDNNYIYVGGSDIDFVGDKRMSSNYYIYILSYTGNLIQSLKFLNLGNIKEIRLLKDKDYSLSEEN